MQGQTLVVTRLSQVKALKTKGPETVRTPPRVRFPEGCPVVQTVCKSRELAQKVQSKDSKISKYWPDDLLGSIAKTINRQCKQPSQTEFKFELSKESAAKNFCILNKYGKDLGMAIKAQSNSPLSYGSEFRPTSTLANVFDRHPNWNRLKDILENGSNWPLDSLNESDRKTDMEEAIAFGNHKGAERIPVLPRKLVEKM